jgi:hypothetical protein
MTKTIYEKELQKLKSHDEVQFTQKCDFSGYPFITTAGHGYLAIPRNDKQFCVARKIHRESGYGYKGDFAIYLEEDQEAPDFLKAIGKYPSKVA